MLQTTARGLDGTTCLAPDRCVVSIPSPAVHAHQLPANLPPQAPLELKGVREAVPHGRGNMWCAPGVGSTANLGQKGERKAEVASHVSNVNWETFKFLLSAAYKARNKTSHYPDKAAWLPPAHMHLGTGNTHVPWTQLLPRGTVGSYRKTSVSAGFGNHLCSQHCLREAKVHSGTAHLTGSLVHTHYKSGCLFSLLRSLMQMAPKRFEKLPHLLAPLPQVTEADELNRSVHRTTLWIC